jgi:soluble cytochrome b562
LKFCQFDRRWIFGWIVVLFVTAPAMWMMHAVADEGADEPPINVEMEILNDHYRTLRRQARRNQYDDATVGMIAEMQAAALSAMHMAVPKAQELPDTERKAVTLDYRRDMAAFVKALLDIEIALLEGRSEDAGELITNLGAMKSDGHEKFHPEGE